MQPCFFASDLHGSLRRYRALEEALHAERPLALFLGGDLLPGGLGLVCGSGEDFVEETLAPLFRRLRGDLGTEAPAVFLVPGNDDPATADPALEGGAAEGLWHLVDRRKVPFAGRMIYGYGLVPPSPFPLKDRERYDVSRYVDPGCVSPEEGMRTVPVPPHEARWRTIRDDLEVLAGDDDVQDAVFLFHAPPYQTALDRAALDGRTVDHVPLDVHVGSVAIRRFIEARQPRLTLHGHVHEAPRLAGRWQERLGNTLCLTGAHDGAELALVRFDLSDPSGATRELR